MVTVTFSGGKSEGVTYWKNEFLKLLKADYSIKICSDKYDQITFRRAESSYEQIEFMVTQFHRDELVGSALNEGMADLVVKVKTFLHEELLPVVKSTIKQEEK